MTNNPKNSKSQFSLETLWESVNTQLFNVGIPGILLGISISHAKEREWGQAKIFCLLAVTAWLALKFASVIAPKIDTIIQKLVDNTEKSITQDRNFSEKRYLEALKIRCHELEIEGFKGDLPLLALEDVFIPLYIDANPIDNWEKFIIKDIWTLLPKVSRKRGNFPYRCIAIVADPGYGKTTLVRYLTLNYANFSYKKHRALALMPIPIFLRSIYLYIESEREPRLPDIIVEQLERLPQFQPMHLSSAWFEEQLQSGRCLVMLDGLDEVPDEKRHKVSQWISWQMHAYLKSQFLVTSRPHGYNSEEFQGVQKVGIYSFNQTQIDSFIDKWYFVVNRQKWRILLLENQEREEESYRLSKEFVDLQVKSEAAAAAADLKKQITQIPTLKKLAANPLLVTIIAATHRAFESLPKRRVQLYRKVLNLLLEDRPNRRDTRLTFSYARDNLDLLRPIAYNLTIKSKLQFTAQDAELWIGKRLNNLNSSSEITVKRFLHEIQTIAGLITGGESNLYQFSHKTFQEYLTAVEINNRGEGKALIKHFDSPALEEIICFYAAITDATPFVKAALIKKTQHRLKLAYRLIREGSRVEPQLRFKLITALMEADLDGELLSEVRLEYRFSSLLPLDENTSITTGTISWGEYKLFMDEQISMRFFSTAKNITISSKELHKPAVGISQGDARWFCAWLCTQSNLQSRSHVYDFRLPASKEFDQLISNEETTISSRDHGLSTVNDGILVTRTKLPQEYKTLITHLSSGYWSQADKETDKLLWELMGHTPAGWIRSDQLEKFPWEHLSMIDQLWTKFSGGKFGFSVQRKIYSELGGKPDGKYPGHSIWHAFCLRTGWMHEDKYISLDDMDFSLLSARQGHLPVCTGRLTNVSDYGAMGPKSQWTFLLIIFSRIAVH
ncbi:MAG: GUN4 domain-containing protein [Cyanobacteria bacterium P01_H01_bin.21]